MGVGTINNRSEVSPSHVTSRLRRCEQILISLFTTATYALDDAMLIAVVDGYVDCVRHLAASGVSVNKQRDEDKYTALLLAAARADVDMMLALLELGADPALTLDGGNTALHVIALEGHDEAVAPVVATGKCAVDVVNDNGASPLVLAAERGHAATVKALLDAGAAVEHRTKGSK